MDFLAVQNSILEQLQSGAPDWPARVYPDNPSGRPPMLSKDGEYLLRYLGSVWEAPMPNRKNVVVQNRISQWEVTARARNLSPQKDASAIYPMLEAARTALKGFTVPSVPDASILYPIREAFVDELDGVWEYALVFGFTYSEAT